MTIILTRGLQIYSICSSSQVQSYKVSGRYRFVSLRYRMAHFYLTLPSNSSMHYYPTNTVTRYTTRLENAIALSGDWEVGLVEIQYQHTWFKLERGEGTFTYSQFIY